VLTKKMQAKIPHFGAGFLRLKANFLAKKQQKGIGKAWGVNLK